MLRYKAPKQIRLEKSPGRALNFAAVTSRGYYQASAKRTRTNCFFKHFSGRHKNVFMVSRGGYKERLANMKLKSSLGCHRATLSCAQSQTERTTVRSDKAPPRAFVLHSPQNLLLKIMLCLYTRFQLCNELHLSYSALRLFKLTVQCLLLSAKIKGC